MPEQLTSDSMIRNTRELALRAFKDHVITRRPHERSWILQRIHADGRPEMTYATEVVALEFRGLYVGGDIEPVIFGGGPADPMGRVFWMGESESWGYIREKAQIGLADNGRLVRRWDRELAVAELRRHIDDSRADAHAEGTKFFVDDFRLEQAYHADDEHSFYDHAYHALRGDFESACSLGVTLDARLIYAHAALTKLSALLRAELAQKAEANAHA